MKKKIKSYVFIILIVSMLIVIKGIAKRYYHYKKYIYYKEQKLEAVVEKIVDGDTIKVYIPKYNSHEKVRLIGIDTPESRKNRRARIQEKELHKDLNSIISMGKQAKIHLANLIPVGSKIILEFDVDKRDRYKRLLAYIWYNQKLINEEMVKDGFALVYTVPPNVKYEDRFLKAYKYAYKNKKGLWSQK